MVSLMDFVHKIATIARIIAAEKGDLILFALIKRAEGIGLWDVVLSASWFDTDEKETLDYIMQKLTENLTSEEMMLISQIRPFPPTDPRIQEILQLVQQRVGQPIKHGHVELSSWTLSSMPVSHAHIFTAQTGTALSQTMPPAGETGARRALE